MFGPDTSQAPQGPIDLLVEKTEEFSRSSLELYRLKTVSLSADIISSLIAKLAVALFFTLFFLIVNIGAALWIGSALGSSSAGFFIVAGFYGLGWVLLSLFSGRWIKAPIRNLIINQALTGMQ
jgi:hypothetical protein